MLAGEIRGPVKSDQEEVINKVRECIKDIGYDQEGFSWKTANVETYLHEQSKDIAMGVDSKDNKDEGAGDQGIMFGYACNDNDAYLPAPIYYAHEVLKELKSQRQHVLGPDAKLVPTSAALSSPDQIRNSSTEPFIPGSPQLVAPIASKVVLIEERSLVSTSVSFWFPSIQVLRLPSGDTVIARWC